MKCKGEGRKEDTRRKTLGNFGEGTNSQWTVQRRQSLFFWSAFAPFDVSQTRQPSDFLQLSLSHEKDEIVDCLESRGGFQFVRFLVPANG